MYSPKGSAGIFRVRSQSNGYGDTQSTIDLEHGITEVGDFVCNAEISEDSNVANALTKIMTYYKGNRWQLGNISQTNYVVLEVNYDNVLEAILSVMEQVPNLMLSFDFSTSPWTINVVSRGQTVTAEGRLDRNVTTASITYDTSEMATRVFVPYDVSTTDATGTSTTEQIATYNASNSAISQYGVIERSLSGSGYTQTQADKVAGDYLAKHSKPTIGVEISALDLSAITGESMDTFAIGKLFRLAIPKYNVTIEENITGLSYDGLYTDDVSVMVSLADVEDAILKTVQKTSSTATSASKKASGARNATNGLIADKNHLYYDVYDNNGVFHTYFEVADRKISLVVDDTTGEINAAGIWLSIDAELKRSHAKISADLIELDGNTIANYLKAQTLEVSALDVTNGVECGAVDAGYIDCTGLNTNGGDISCDGIDCDGMTFDGSNVTWKSFTHHVFNVSASRPFLYGSTSGASGTVTGYILISHSTTTINYMGR